MPRAIPPQTRTDFTQLCPLPAQGYGLAVMVDVMSAVLSGAAYGTNIGSLERLEPESTGFFMLLVDPSRFMPLDEFLGRMDDYIDMLKSGKRQPGVEEIFVPGEIEARKQEDNMESGIELSASLMEELRLRAAQIGSIDEGDSFDAMLKKLTDKYRKE